MSVKFTNMNDLRLDNHPTTVSNTINPTTTLTRIAEFDLLATYYCTQVRNFSVPLVFRKSPP